MQWCLKLDNKLTLPSRCIPLKTNFLKKTMCSKKKKSVYWFVKWWLVLATGLSSSAGAAKYPWSCWKTICEKLWTGQMGFCLRWMTWKSEPEDSQTTIIILVSGSSSTNHCIDPCVILGNRESVLLCVFWQSWLLSIMPYTLWLPWKMPTLNSWTGLRDIKTEIFP